MDLSNLNKTDLHHYYNFLKQSKKGFGNSLIDKSILLINDYIINNYNSNDFVSMTLEDFIQECFIVVMNKNIRINKASINKIYDFFKKWDNNQAKKINIIEGHHEINYNSIYFSAIIEELKPMLNGAHEKEILDYILKNNDMSVDNASFGVTYQRISQIKETIFNKLRLNKDFREVNQEYIIDAKKYYINRLKEMSLEYFIFYENNFDRDFRNSFRIYLREKESLTKEDLRNVIELLYYIKRFDYYKYHKDEIDNIIEKERHKYGWFTYLDDIDKKYKTR